VPLPARAAALLIAQQSQGRLIHRLEALLPQLGEGFERASAAELLAAFQGIDHRCSVALRRLEGLDAPLDYAIALGGGDVQGRILAPLFEMLTAMLQTNAALADAWALAYYDLMPLAGGDTSAARERDAWSGALLGEIGEQQRAVDRLREARAAFE
jgi:hypothetical protein